MAQDYYDDMEDEQLGPSKSQLKRIQNELQDLGKEMTKFGDETLSKIGLPEEVLVEIQEFRKMRTFGAQRRQLQLIGKKMRDLDPAAVREAINHATGASQAAVALLHRCESLREQLIESDETLTKFVNSTPNIDIPKLRTLIRNSRKEREQQKPPKNQRELYHYIKKVLSNKKNTDNK